MKINIPSRFVLILAIVSAFGLTRAQEEPTTLKTCIHQMQALHLEDQTWWMFDTPANTYREVQTLDKSDDGSSLVGLLSFYTNGVLSTTQRFEFPWNAIDSDDFTIKISNINNRTWKAGDNRIPWLLTIGTVDDKLSIKFKKLIYDGDGNVTNMEVPTLKSITIFVHSPEDAQRLKHLILLAKQLAQGQSSASSVRAPYGQAVPRGHPKEG